MSEMITRSEMFCSLLEVCPSFRPAWEAFLLQWRDELDLPLHIALGGLARHLIAMLASGETSRFPEIFAVVERWQTDGDANVREYATVGLLENLQNESLHDRTVPEQFDQFLLPASRESWLNLSRFWSPER